MPFCQKLQMYHHTTRFFTVDGKHFEIVGTLSTSNTGTGCIDLCKDEAGHLHRIPRAYFIGKTVVYHKNTQIK